MRRPHRAKPSGSTSAADRPGAADTAGPAPPASRWPTIAAAGLIVLSAVAAYHNSFAAPWIYDDAASIVENRTIRQLWPLGPVLSPPRSGQTVSGRPLLNLSLAVNYALGGLSVRGYHAANLGIHVAAALLLFGILRRTFLTPLLRDRFGGAATPLALASAVLWTVHPLQTESVTYIVQRAESLAGFFCLLTLYCVIRAGATVGLSSSAGSTVGQAGHRPNVGRGTHAKKGTVPLGSGWYVAAILACLLGMACKEVMVTAPLIVLLYDRTFLAGSLAEAWRRRWGLYLDLAATWGLLGHLVFSTGLIGRQSELGAPDAWSYLRSQPGVILHYLRLSVWPSPLCFDYGWPAAKTPAEILPGTMVIGILLAATVWGLLGRRASGFLGAWFLLTLAPSSSILPLRQLAFEHRMYLALAAVAVAAVTGGYVLWDNLFHRAGQGGQSPSSPSMTQGNTVLWAAKKGAVPGGAALMRWTAPVVVLAMVLLALGYATVLRNADYRSALAIWQDAFDKRPNNPVALNNLGTELAALGRTDEAMELFREALRLKPDFAVPHYNLGAALGDAGRTDAAIEHYQQALRLRPDYAEAHNNLGNALAGLGRTDEAVAHYHEALRLRPDYAEAHNNFAACLAAVGSVVEAIEHYEEALRLKPDYANAHYNLGAALARSGRISEAIEHWNQALRLKPEDAEAHYNLGNALVDTGRFNEAIDHYQRAIQLAESSGQTSLAKLIRGRLELYRGAKGIRD